MCLVTHPCISLRQTGIAHKSLVTRPFTGSEIAAFFPPPPPSNIPLVPMSYPTCDVYARNKQTRCLVRLHPNPGNNDKPVPRRTGASIVSRIPADTSLRWRI